MKSLPTLSEQGDIFAGADLVILPVFCGATVTVPPAIAALWPDLVQVETILARRPHLCQETGDLVVVQTSDGRDVMVVGLGPATADLDNCLRVAQQLASNAARPYRRAVTMLPMAAPDRAKAVRAVAEGALLGIYRPPGAPKAKDETDTVLALAPGEADDPAVKSAFEVACIAGQTLNFVRNLVDLPPRELTPTVLAATLARKAESLGISACVWDLQTMKNNGFGGVLGVGSGSAECPTVLVLRAGNADTGPLIGLAGKGMTFDSGGINLKRNLAEIFRMKDDMAGAAAVAGAIFAAAGLGARLNVLAVLPMAENMPSGSALRPGDVITHPGGRRTEIVDTDCEGRLILADAIAWLRLQGAETIIDVGTLTDGGGVGPLLWGCWSTHTALAQSVLAAGEKAGEPGWQLPLRTEYSQFMTSQVADSANAPLDVPDIGLTAATFLRPHAGSTPWLHIDNGSSAFMESPIAGWPKGGTGSPMRALMQWLIDNG